MYHLFGFLNAVLRLTDANLVVGFSAWVNEINMFESHQA